MNFKLSAIWSFFKSGHKRTLTIKKHIIGSVFVKGLSILVSLLLVPITLNYLDSEKYGIWLTISSVIFWFGFLDIGLGNGLRNKLAEALAGGDLKLAQKYVSTSYFVLALISFSSIVFFSFYLEFY